MAHCGGRRSAALFVTAIIVVAGCANLVGASFAFRQTLTAAQPEADAALGKCVAASGNRVVISAPSGAGGGSAVVFVSDPETDGLVPSQELTGPDTVAADRFGEAIAMDGSTLVVTAPGHASEAGGEHIVELRAFLVPPYLMGVLPAAIVIRRPPFFF